MTQTIRSEADAENVNCATQQCVCLKRIKVLRKGAQDGGEQQDVATERRMRRDFTT